MINLKHLAFRQRVIVELDLLKADMHYVRTDTRALRTDMREVLLYIRSKQGKDPEKRFGIKKAKDMNDYTFDPEKAE